MHVVFAIDHLATVCGANEKKHTKSLISIIGNSHSKTHGACAQLFHSMSILEKERTSAHFNQVGCRLFVEQAMPSLFSSFQPAMIDISSCTQQTHNIEFGPHTLYSRAWVGKNT
jgi:oligoribonuclease (3'-5' exoribonuclease)